MVEKKKHKKVVYFGFVKDRYRFYNFFCSIVCLVWAIALSGCPRKPSRSGPGIPGGRRIEGKVSVYTESSPVNALVASTDSLWVGTHNGLIRWDLKSGGAVQLTTLDGLPGNDVLALAVDIAGGLWLATPEGIAFYKEGRWTHFGDCPLGREIETLAPSGEGDGVWVGGRTGLYRHIFGRWQQIKKNIHVTALLSASGDKTVWVGTRDSGLFECTAAKCTPHGKSKGLEFSNIRQLSFNMKGILALGSSDKGDRLGIYQDGRWHTYGLKPQVLLQWVRFAMGRTWVSVGERIYNLLEGKHVKPKKSVPRLEGSADSPAFSLAPVELPLPSSITQVAGALGYLWVGTQSLGVIRYDGERFVSYRTGSLGRGAKKLSIACDGPIECYVTNGASAFRFDGTVWATMDRTVSGELQAYFQYFLKDDKNRVIGIYRNESGYLQVAHLEDGLWKPWNMKASIKAPRPLTVTAGGFDFFGRLWVGLAKIDTQGEPHGYGCAMIDPVSGDVVYHRNFQGSGEAGEGSLSLPNDITSFAFIEQDVWLSSSSGACRIRDTYNVKCFTTADGLSSDMVREVVVGPNENIWAVSVEGLDELTGNTFETRLSTRFSDRRFRTMVMDSKGALWLGGVSGLGLFKNGRVEIYDEDSQILESNIKHLARDSRGRIWALHPGGISIIER